MNVTLKVAIFITCFLSVKGLSDEIENFLKGVRKRCQEESGASLESIESQRGEFATDQAFKCYLKCTMVELKTMDKDGIINIEKAVEALPQEMKDLGVPHFVRTCGIQAGTDICDTAWRTLKCYKSVGPDVFIPI